MTLETLKIESDILKAQSARKELEYKKAKLLDDIKRIEYHMSLQDERVIELQKELGE